MHYFTYIYGTFLNKINRADHSLTQSYGKIGFLDLRAIFSYLRWKVKHLFSSDTRTNNL